MLWAASLPGAFLFAGGGLLWLYRVRIAEGGFYERLINNQADWIGAHFLLWASATLMIPASLALWYVVRGKRGAGLADVALVLMGLAFVPVARKISNQAQIA